MKLNYSFSVSISGKKKKKRGTAYDLANFLAVKHGGGSNIYFLGCN